MYDGPGVGAGLATMLGSMALLLPVLIGLWVLVGTVMATWVLANAKGLNTTSWVIFSILFSFIALIAAAGMPSEKGSVVRLPAAGPQLGGPSSP